MKKIIILLFVFFLIPIISLASSVNEFDYVPELNMDFQSFIQYYNAIQTSKASTLLPLKSPSGWYNNDDYVCASFIADSDSHVIICLLSKEKEKINNLYAGLDIVSIYTQNEKDLISLITVAIRCASLFVNDRSDSEQSIAETISRYYEYNNRNKNKKYHSFSNLDKGGKYCLMFSEGTGFTFDICSYSRFLNN